MSKEELEGCCVAQCHFIVPIAGGICALSMLPAVYTFITARIAGKLKVSKRIFYGGLFFFVAIFCALISWSMFNATMCDYPRLNYISHSVFQQLYTIENMIFVAILFDRLYKIFENTEFKLHRCSIRAFVTYYVIAATLVAVYGVLNTNHVLPGSLVSSIGALIGLLGLILIIWVMTLYLYKLGQVYKYKHDDEQLLPIITKTSLLCVGSTLATFCMIVSLSMLTVNRSAWHTLLYELLVLGDIYTNYLCVWLSYQHVRRHYKRLCRCCHMQCQKLWMWYFHRNEEITLIEIQSRTVSPSVASRSSTTKTAVFNMSAVEASKQGTEINTDLQ